MAWKRAGGVLLHPTSLPGPYGIGDLGPEADRFLDWLSSAGCRLWQVLPLGPTGYGNSPYQCHSVFAGNPYLVSPEYLVRDGLLRQSDLTGSELADQHAKRGSGRVDFGWVITRKLQLLRLAYDRFDGDDPAGLREDFAAFRAQNAAWLDDYALFMALKEAHGGGSWQDWPEDIRLRRSNALRDARRSFGNDVVRHAFYQWVFFRQWSVLRQRAHRLGIQIIGDLPIFCAEDSADLWANPELFHVDAAGHPTVLAGVPPDYFSPTGQLWGNPLYNWDAHEQTGYAWWLARFRTMLQTVDIVRLDHFRGFCAYWEVQAGNVTAEVGRWVPGPGPRFLEIARAALHEYCGDGQLPIIAEDLGVITPDVVEARERFGLPGMRILQFGFSGPENRFLPHNYVRDTVAYTGTHDNDTARGWLKTAPAHERDFALRYLGTAPRNFTWAMIRAVWASVASFAVVPMQDVLELGSEARMNFPSKPAGNWEWRMSADAAGEPRAAKLAGFSELYGR